MRNQPWRCYASLYAQANVGPRSRPVADSSFGLGGVHEMAACPQKTASAASGLSLAPAKAVSGGYNATGTNL